VAILLTGKAHNPLTLKLDFVLNDKGLSLVLNLLWELGRDRVMSCCVLDNKALIALHSLVDMGLFYSPLSNICPFLILVRALCVLLGVRWLPSCLPIVCELLKKVGLEGSRLRRKTLACQLNNCGFVISLCDMRGLTVKVGSSRRDDVEDEASLATLEMEELASLRTDCASALAVPASKAAAEMAAVAEKRIVTKLQRIDRIDQMN
jgi:hypothetical protein